MPSSLDAVPKRSTKTRTKLKMKTKIMMKTSARNVADVIVLRVCRSYKNPSRDSHGETKSCFGRFDELSKDAKLLLTKERQTCFNARSWDEKRNITVAVVQYDQENLGS